MSKLFSKLAVIFLLFVFCLHQVSASGIPKEIITCFKTGNSKVLNDFLNSSVELQILEDENVYSKAQAEQIINNFFINTSYKISLLINCA